MNVIDQFLSEEVPPSPYNVGTDIDPLVSVGDVEFGMTRKKVRELLGHDPSSFKKTSTSKPVDAYEYGGIYVHYDKRDKCNYIELFKQSHAILYDRLVFEMPLKRLIKLLTKFEKKKNGRIEKEDGNIIFHNIGIVLTITNNKLDCIAAFSKGYYS